MNLAFASVIFLVVGVAAIGVTALVLLIMMLASPRSALVSER